VTAAKSKNANQEIGVPRHKAQYYLGDTVSQELIFVKEKMEAQICDIWHFIPVRQHQRISN
jgi:hypothetical protein